MYKNNDMNEFNDCYFDFYNSNYPKLPFVVKAKYCFENELIEIPGTDVFFNVDSELWAVYDKENDNLFSMTNDQFLDIYIASDKKAQRYVEFVLDSKINNYIPSTNLDNFNMFEEIFGDLIEKEAPIKNRWKLIFDLVLNKKIYLSKYL